MINELQKNSNWLIIILSLQTLPKFLLHTWWYTEEIENDTQKQRKGKGTLLPGNRLQILELYQIFCNFRLSGADL